MERSEQAQHGLSLHVEGELPTPLQLAAAGEPFDPMFEIMPGTKPPAEKPKTKGVTSA